MRAVWSRFPESSALALGARARPRTFRRRQTKAVHPLPIFLRRATLVERHTAEVTEETEAVSLAVGVLRSPLTPLQLELLETVWWPVRSSRDTGVPATWPVWDYVSRSMHAGHPDLDDAVTVLDSLPRLELTTPLKSHPYGLIWRNSHPSMRPAPEHRIGLSIAGMAALASAGKLHSDIPDAYAQIIAQLANSEARIEAPPDQVAAKDTPLSSWTPWLNTPSHDKPTVIPDRITAPLLNAEYAPVFVFPVDAEDGHTVQLGRARLRRFRHVNSASDYLDVIDEAEALRIPPPRYRSPLTLVQTFDYLGLVLAADSEWTAGHLTNAPDLQSASAVSATVSDRHDYQTALTGLCTIIDQLTVPPIPPDELNQLPNDRARQDAQGTINRLARWLTRRIKDRGDLDRVEDALRTIRDVRALRVEGQHHSPDTVRRATSARRRLGLSDTVADYPATWAHVQDELAGALDVIRQEVQATGSETRRG
jgi:hypothetical protein